MTPTSEGCVRIRDSICRIFSPMSSMCQYKVDITAHVMYSATLMYKDEYFQNLDFRIKHKQAVVVVTSVKLRK